MRKAIMPDKSEATHQEFRLKTVQGLPEIYVDGVSALFPGWPNSKVIFHSAYPSDPGAETRRAVLVLTLPTGTLLEMSRNVLRAFAGNEPDVRKAAEAHLARVEEFLSGGKKAATKPSTRDAGAKSKRAKS